MTLLQEQRPPPMPEAEQTDVLPTLDKWKLKQQRKWERREARLANYRGSALRRSSRTIALLIAAIFAPFVWNGWVAGRNIGSVHFHRISDGWVTLSVLIGVFALAAWLARYPRAARTMALGSIALTAVVGGFTSDQHDATGGFEFAQKQPSQCNMGFNVQLDPNTGRRLKSSGIDPESSPAQFRKELLELTKHDPRALQAWWNDSPAGRVDPVRDFKELTDPAQGNGCYSQRGWEVWQQFAGQLKAANLESAQVPASGINTGATPGGAPFQTSATTISGDRRGTRVTYGNGQVSYGLHRCLNVVSEKPIPKVVIVKKPPPTVVVKKPPPKQPPEQPRNLKCFDANGNPINRDANGNCGTPGSGADFQHPQSDIPASARVQDTGCTGSGCGERRIESQERPDDGGSRSGGIDNGGEAPSNPDGGADEGTSDPHPDDQGFNEEPVNNGDPGPG